jgi:putative transposase
VNATNLLDTHQDIGDNSGPSFDLEKYLRMAGQIITILKEAEGGAKVTELCRRHGISDATFYTWRSKYGGLEVSEMRRLRQLEEENRRLKSIVADQALDIRALKDVQTKNGYGPR